MVAKIFDMEEMPNFQKLKTGAKRKYPWMETPPGQGFPFDADISLGGARAQVANAMRSMSPPDDVTRKFVVRVDPHNHYWCIRVDGLTEEQRERWRERPASRPVGHRELTDEMVAGLRQAGPHEVIVEERGETNPDKGRKYSIGLVDPGEDDLI